MSIVKFTIMYLLQGLHLLWCLRYYTKKKIFFHRVLQIFKLNIFQHFILFLKIAIAYIIPDVPTNLNEQLDRERQTQREKQYKDNQRKLREERRESLKSSDNVITGKEGVPE